MRVEVDKKAKAKWMRESGASIAETAETIGVSRHTIIRWTTPGYNEKSMAISRAWKERNRNTCACGETIRHEATQCRACANAMRKKWTPELIIECIQRFALEHGEAPAAREWMGPRRDGYPGTTSVVHVFGSWNAAISAAGFTPRPPGRHSAGRAEIFQG